MHKRILPILFFSIFFYFISVFINSSISFAATEFVSSVMQSGGDYNSLSSWIMSVAADLTVSSTKVYSVSTSTSASINGATVIGSVSTTTKATVLHNSTINSQVLVNDLRKIITGTSTFSTSSNIVTGTGTLYTTELAVNDYIWLESSQTWQKVSSIASSTQLTLTATSTISGTGQTSVRGKSNFQSGEQLQKINGPDYIVISNTGDSAIVTAKIDGAWTSPDTAAVTISATTSAANYINIYTTTAARHDGKWNTNKYRLESTNVINLQVDFIRIDGLQVSRIVAGSDGDFYINSTVSPTSTDIRISNNIIKFTSVSGTYNRLINIEGGQKTSIWNNILYGAAGANNYAIDTNYAVAGNTSFVYNNTVFGSYNGIFSEATNHTMTVKNNIVQGATNGYYAPAGWGTGSDYNISNDNTAPGSNSKNSANVSFVSTSTSDFHLSPTDTTAKDSATSSPATDPNLSFTTDIDGQTRPWGSAWDIGADEFVNTAPNAPVSLGQYQSGCSSSISTSTYWISTSTVCFQGKVSDPNVNDLEKLQVELSTSTFSNSPNYTASSFTTSTATSSANATATSSITVSSLPDGQYKWQARLLDYSNGTSTFTQFNSGTNSFGIDTIAPTGTIASSTFGTITTSSIIINRPSTSTITESGSGLYQWQARRNSTTTLSAVSTSTATTSDSSLTSNTQYTYDVRFIDLVGNNSSYGATSSKYTLTPTPTNFSAAPSQTSNILSVDSFNNPSSGSSGYYFSNTTNSNNSGWITTNSWTDTGLTCNTSYSYTIKYRNGDATESATSSVSQTTSACAVSSAISGAGLPISILSSPTKKVQPISSPNINKYPPISSPASQYQSISFSKYLYIGLSHPDVKNLQSLLSNYPDIYPEGKITGYYGQLTKQAVQKLQIKYNITNQSDKAFGYVGPSTRKVLNLLEQINYLQNQLNQILTQFKRR